MTRSSRMWQMSSRSWRTRPGCVLCMLCRGRRCVSATWLRYSASPSQRCRISFVPCERAASSGIEWTASSRSTASAITSCVRCWTTGYSTSRVRSPRHDETAHRLDACCQRARGYHALGPGIWPTEGPGRIILRSLRSASPLARFEFGFRTRRRSVSGGEHLSLLPLERARTSCSRSRSDALASPSHGGARVRHFAIRGLRIRQSHFSPA